MIRALSDFLVGLDRFQLEMTLSGMVQEGADDPPATVVDSRFLVAMERPNKLCVLAEAAADPGRGGLKVVCDGDKVYTYVASAKKYTVKDAPPQRDGIMQTAGVSMGLMGWCLDLLLTRQPYELLLIGLAEARYAGPVKLGDFECDRLELNHEQFDMQFWMDVGQRPVLRQVVVDYAPARKPPVDGQPQLTRKEVTIRFNNWQINSELPKEQFVFSPPSGATKVRSFFEKPKHPLVDRPAPEFTLNLLEGGKFDVAEHRNKHVVILEFWATWCGPCVYALPVLQKVAEAYRDQGVVLYAVNLREPRYRVSSFLEHHKLKLSVPLDTYGQVQRLYRVGNVPQTVVIGADGIVKHVQVGVSQRLEKYLTAVLEMVLSESKAARMEEPAEITNNE